MAYSLINNQLVNEIPLSNCKLQNVIDILLHQSASRQSAIAKNQMLIINQLQKITDKVPDNNKPIGDQLSASELKQFNKLSEQIGNMNISLLIESRYERDLEVINNLIKIVENYFSLGSLPSMDGDDATYAAILNHWEQNIRPKFTVNKSDLCSLDYALFQLEYEAGKRFLQLSENGKEGIKRINMIYAKYPGENKEKIKLSSFDKQEIENIQQNIVLPYVNEKRHMDIIENIREFNKISQFIYNETTQGLINSGGDIDKAWDTINEMVKSGKLSTWDIEMIAYWQVINDLIPSEVIKAFKLSQ